MYSRHIVSAVLVCASLLVSYGIPAQTRGPPARREAVQRSHDRTAQLVQLDGWLRGLAGDYKLHITSTRAPDLPCLRWSGPGGSCVEWGGSPTGGGGVFNGSAECRSIGTGSGMRCFFTSNLAPAPGMPMVILFGVQAVDPAIRVLSVDVSGAALESRGSLTRGRITLNTQCPPGHNCPRLLQLSSRNGGQVIEILFSKGRIPVLAGGPPPSNTRIEMRRITSTATPSTGDEE